MSNLYVVSFALKLLGISTGLGALVWIYMLKKKGKVTQKQALILVATMFVSFVVIYSIGRLFFNAWWYS